MSTFNPDLHEQIYANIDAVPTPSLIAQIYCNVGTGFGQVIEGEPFYPPPLHIPHKEWATAEEARNYYTIERWSYVLSTDHFPSPFHLHIPYTSWADNNQERANYSAIERWALSTQTQGYTLPLHFPFKRWAYDDEHGDARLEEDNYRHIEWWSTLWAGYPGTEGPGVPPIYPDLHEQIYMNVT